MKILNKCRNEVFVLLERTLSKFEIVRSFLPFVCITSTDKFFQRNMRIYPGEVAKLLMKDFKSKY